MIDNFEFNEEKSNVSISRFAEYYISDEFTDFDFFESRHDWLDAEYAADVVC
jgi:hypothetical protein